LLFLLYAACLVEVVVPFVDIGGIVDPSLFKVFLFITITM
jgi:hypothetical protein